MRGLDSEVVKFCMLSDGIILIKTILRSHWPVEIVQSNYMPNMVDIIN
jgi:hypothetical protein